MLTVVIYINGTPVVARSVRNVTADEQVPSEVIRRQGDTYRCDDGRTILHHQKDGCVALAIKALKGVQQ